MPQKNLFTQRLGYLIVRIIGRDDKSGTICIIRRGGISIGDQQMFTTFFERYGRLMEARGDDIDAGKSPLRHYVWVYHDYRDAKDAFDDLTAEKWDELPFPQDMRTVELVKNLGPHYMTCGEYMSTGLSYLRIYYYVGVNSPDNRFERRLFQWISTNYLDYPPPLSSGPVYEQYYRYEIVLSPAMANSIYEALTILEFERFCCTSVSVKWRVGQQVRICATPSASKSWFSQMNRCCGQVGTVLEVFESSDCVRVQTPTETWTYQSDWCQDLDATPIAIAPTPTATATATATETVTEDASIPVPSMWKAGDTVRICATPPIADAWFIQMNSCCGQVGTVLEVFESSGHMRVRTASGTWTYQWEWCLDPDAAPVAIAPVATETATKDAASIPVPAPPVWWQVGDTVRICGTPPITDGLSPRWDDRMNSCCGQIGTVTDLLFNKHPHVQLTDSSLKSWYFRPEWCLAPEASSIPAAPMVIETVKSISENVVKVSDFSHVCDQRRWKAGDQVRIRATPPIDDNCLPVWTADMDQYCGRVGKIVRRNDDDYLLIEGAQQVTIGVEHVFRSEWFQVLETETPEKTDKATKDAPLTMPMTWKVGDKVRIQASPPTDYTDSDLKWSRAMDCYCGQVGVVVNTYYNDRLLVQFAPYALWYFRPEWCRPLEAIPVTVQPTSMVVEQAAESVGIPHVWKVGDKVRIQASPPTDYTDSDPKWIRAMDDYCGQVGVVMATCYNDRLLIQFIPYVQWYFRPEWCRPLETIPIAVQPAPLAVEQAVESVGIPHVWKVGDKVRIQASPPTNHYDSEPRWAGTMDGYCGQVGIVMEICDGSYRIRFARVTHPTTGPPYVDWYFRPEWCLAPEASSITTATKDSVVIAGAMTMETSAITMKTPAITATSDFSHVWKVGDLARIQSSPPPRYSLNWNRRTNRYCGWIGTVLEIFIDNDGDNLELLIKFTEAPEREWIFRADWCQYVEETAIAVPEKSPAPAIPTANEPEKAVAAKAIAIPHVWKVGDLARIQSSPPYVNTTDWSCSSDCFCGHVGEVIEILESGKLVIWFTVPFQEDRIFLPEWCQFVEAAWKVGDKVLIPTVLPSDEDIDPPLENVFTRRGGQVGEVISVNTPEANSHLLIKFADSGKEVMWSEWCLREPQTLPTPFKSGDHVRVALPFLPDSDHQRLKVISGQPAIVKRSHTCRSGQNLCIVDFYNQLQGTLLTLPSKWLEELPPLPTFKVGDRVRVSSVASLNCPHAEKALYRGGIVQFVGSEEIYHVRLDDPDVHPPNQTDWILKAWNLEACKEPVSEEVIHYAVGDRIRVCSSRPEIYGRDGFPPWNSSKNEILGKCGAIKEVESKTPQYPSPVYTVRMDDHQISTLYLVHHTWIRAESIPIPALSDYELTIINPSMSVITTAETAIAKGEAFRLSAKINSPLGPFSLCLEAKSYDEVHKTFAQQANRIFRERCDYVDRQAEEHLVQWLNTHLALKKVDKRFRSARPEPTKESGIFRIVAVSTDGVAETIAYGISGREILYPAPPLPS